MMAQRARNNVLCKIFMSKNGIMVCTCARMRLKQCKIKTFPCENGYSNGVFCLFNVNSQDAPAKGVYCPQGTGGKAKPETVNRKVRNSQV